MAVMMNIQEEYYVFHQNMRVFGGGTLGRNEAFDGAFIETVSNKMGQDKHIIVAGFTEITNATIAKDALQNASSFLFNDAKYTIGFFACGVTALKQGQAPEYVVISCRHDFTISFSGRVLLMSDQKWKCWPWDKFPNDRLPEELTADSRGLAYVGGNFKNQQMIIGFMHNMYKEGNRSGGFSALPTMMKLIWEAHSGWGNVPIYLGGDFNVKPRGFSSRADAQVICAVDANNNNINTTRTHPYDYWVTSDPKKTNGDVTVCEETRDVVVGLSDHAGVLLRVLVL